MAPTQASPPPGGTYRPKAHLRHAAATLGGQQRAGALCPHAAPEAPVTDDLLDITCGACKRMLGRHRREQKQQQTL